MDTGAGRFVEPARKVSVRWAMYFSTRGIRRKRRVIQRTFGKVGGRHQRVYPGPTEGESRSPLMLGGSPAGIYLYVRDVDETFRKALEAGASEKRPVEDMFWGDRTGSVVDPYGHTWDLATHREDVPPEEMKRRGEEFFRKMEGGKT